MLKKIFMGFIGIVVSGCSPFSDPEIVVRTKTEQRKPKPDYMPPEERPLETHTPEKKVLPIAPQVGIRIPFEK